MRAGLVASCHDVSEGGLAVALAEMCIGGRVGATIDHLPHDDLATALFSESVGRLVVELDPRNAAAFTTLMGDQIVRLGTVDDSGSLSLPGLEPIAVSALADAFSGEDSREGNRA
jgi:phosphoribosylformylglycinamidine synthase